MFRNTFLSENRNSYSLLFSCFTEYLLLPDVSVTVRSGFCMVLQLMKSAVFN